MADAVGVAEDVVVVPGLVAVGVGDVGQADVFVPLQPRVEAAVVGPFTDCFRVRAGALPLQVHAAIRAVGVAGDQVVLVLVAPRCAVFVLGIDQVAVGIVVISRQLAHRRAVADFPQACEAPVFVHHRAQVQMDVVEVALVGDEVGQYRLVSVAVFVVQHDACAVAQFDLREQEAVAVAHVAFLALKAAAQQQGVFRDAHQRQVFDGVVVRLADGFECVFMLTAVRIVEHQPLVVKVKAGGEFGEPARAQGALVVGTQA